MSPNLEKVVFAFIVLNCTRLLSGEYLENHTNQFTQLLHTFKECTFTYYHYLYYSVTTHSHKDEWSEILDVILNKFGNVQTTYKTAQDSVAKSKWEYLSKSLSGSTRLSTCTIRILHSWGAHLLTKSFGNDKIFRPNHIWILMQSKVIENRGWTSRVKKALPELKVSGVVFIAIEAFNLTYFWRPQKRHPLTPIIIGRDIITQEDVWKIWSKLHHNMGQLVVGVQPDQYGALWDYMYDRNQEIICRPFIKSVVEVHPGQCSVYTTAMKLNFTISEIIYGSIFEKNEVSKLKHSSLITTGISYLFKSIFRGRYLSSGVQISTQSFISVKQNFSKSQVMGRADGLFRPLEWSVWLLLTFANLLVAAIFTLNKAIDLITDKNNVAFRDKPNWRETFGILKGVFFSLSSFLLSQPPTASAVLNIEKTVLMPIAFFWGLVVLVIQQAYQADFFSLLSYTILPTVPQNLTELVSSDCRIGTISECYENMMILGVAWNGVKKRSCLLTTLEDKLQNDALLNGLNNKAKWLEPKNNISGVAYGILNNGTEVRTNGSNKYYAVVDKTSKIIEPLAAILSIFGKDAWVSKAKPIPALDEFLVFEAYENYFLSFLSRSIAQIEESGLFQLWDKFSSRQMIVKEIQEYQNLTDSVQGERMMSFRNQFLNCQGDCKFRTTKNSGMDRETFTLVSKDTLNIIILYWVIGLAGTLICFLSEYSWGKLHTLKNSCILKTSSIPRVIKSGFKMQLLLLFVMASFLLVGLVIAITFMAQKRATRNDTMSEPQDIPSTGLKTRTSYKLHPKRFPSGIISWTSKSKGSYNFVQVANDPSHLQKYKRGGEWFKDAQWQFIPVMLKGKETGWFGLRNKGVPKAYLSWAKNERVNDHAYHAVLDTNYKGIKRKSDFFLKPKKVQLEGENYYQIIFKSLPEGKVMLSEEKYGNGFYIQADVRNDSSQSDDKYKFGSSWFNDTLFIFEAIIEPESFIKVEAKKAEPKMGEEDIGDLE